MNTLAIIWPEKFKPSNAPVVVHNEIVIVQHRGAIAGFEIEGF